MLNACILQLLTFLSEAVKLHNSLSAIRMNLQQNNGRCDGKTVMILSYPQCFLEQRQKLGLSFPVSQSIKNRCHKFRLTNRNGEEGVSL